MKEHGLKLLQAGRLNEAYQAFVKAVNQAPSDVDCRILLGVTCGYLGNIQQAVMILQEAACMAPASASAWCNLGLAQLNASMLQEAEQSLLKAIELNPADAVAYNNLGTLYRQQGNVDAAMQSYETALRINPRDSNVLNNLGGVLQGLCRTDEAISAYQRALKIRPDFAQCEFNLGSALQADGQHERALYFYNKAISHDPSIVDAKAAIARVYEKEGKYKEAIDALLPLLHGRETAVPVAMAFATVAKRTDQSGEAVTLLRSMLERNDISQIERQGIEYLLGDLYDIRGEYDTAFRYYHQANTRRKYSCDRSVYERHVSQVKRCFPPGSIRQYPGREFPPVIFIVGMPRSSTSLVEQILASHPDVHGGGELPYVGNQLARLSRDKQIPFDHLLDAIDDGDINDFGRQYLKQVRRLSKDARYVTDKMPHNFLHLGMLGMALPNVRIVNCLRNPVDTCLSIYFHDFNANHPYSTDLAELGHYYRYYQTLMEYWRSILGEQILDVVYEDILDDQEGVTRTLLEFCNLPWSGDCLEFHKSRRIVNTPSYDQVRRPIYKSAKGRWRNYEKDLAPLLDVLNGCS